MDSSKMYESLGISKKALDLVLSAESELSDRFCKIDKIAEYNQLKVLAAFQKNRISEADFAKTTGYGNGDIGRDNLERVYADVFHTEDALVRAQLISGTHAISTALFGNLLPGDEMLSPVGKPYDTLDSIIGLNNARFSLKEHGISYRQVDLKDDETFDFEGIRTAINSKTKLVEIQRSKGYSLRHTLSVDEISDLISFIKGIKPDIICMVDNCYGEFTETTEPSDVGADLIVGSLIKNPGGGLAPIGGYIAGRRDLVENAAFQLIAPGLGKEIGANLGVNKDLYQGLFLSPVVTAAAEKGSVLAAYVYKKLGYDVSPQPEEVRHDIIQAISLKTPEALRAFCEGIQSAAAIDSHVRPEASEMAGYDDEVIMAAGNFISGSSIELSADGPMREPYTVFLQGGLTYPHAKLGVLKSIQRLMDSKII